MKKLFLMVVLFWTILPAFSIDTDYRAGSMGNLKAAVSSDSFNQFSNPAMLGFYEQKHTVLMAAGSDFEFFAGFPFVEQTKASLSFVGSNMLLDFGLRWNPQKQNDGLYTLRHMLSVGTSLAYRISNFSFGVGFDAFSESERTDIFLEQSLFSGIVSETFFGRYKGVQDSQGVELSAGIAYNGGNLSLGILCENIFASSSLSKFDVSFQSVVQSTDAGVFYTMDRFDKKGRLNKNVFSFGFEIQKIGAPENRTLNTGFCFTRQFNRVMSVSLTAGTEVSFSESIEKSLQMMALSFTYNLFEISLCAEVPYSAYYGRNIDKICVSAAADIVF